MIRRIQHAEYRVTPLVSRDGEQYVELFVRVAGSKFGHVVIDFDLDEAERIRDGLTSALDTARGSALSMPAASPLGRGEEANQP